MVPLPGGLVLLLLLLLLGGDGDRFRGGRLDGCREWRLRVIRDRIGRGEGNRLPLGGWWGGKPTGTAPAGSPERKG